MKRNCTNLMTATAAVSALAFSGMLYADQAAMTAPGAGRDNATPAPQQIGSAPLIWDNGDPDGSNGISHFEGVLTGGDALERDAADDFQTGSAGGSGWQVTGVQMSGVWFDGASAPGPLSALRVRIWNDAGGQPGSVFFDATVGFNAVNTGGMFFDRPEVSYTADVSVILDENTTYWIGIQPAGTTDNFFHLTSAIDDDGNGSDPNSCVGNCGGNAGNCWCDEGCCDFADCCADKVAECGGCAPPLGGGALGGGLQGEELQIRGDFTPALPDWAPGSQVFGEAYDLTFKIFGVPAADDCPADLNNDGVVNVSDLLILLGDWGSCPGCPADLNDDGVVNVSDLLILLGDWGNCPEPPAPTGACCFEDGSCTPDVTSDDCDSLGGNYNGNFSSCGTCPQPPSGETCGDALELNDGDTLAADTTGNPVGNAPLCNGLAPNQPTVWFLVEGNGNTMTAAVDSLDPFGNGSNAAVYCASCDSLICVGSASEGSGDNPFDAELSWCATEGETYLVAVWLQGGAGDLEVTLTEGSSCTSTISCAPAGDCVGHCGGQAPSGCWCDNGCIDFADCCQFVCNACPGLVHCDANPGTCEGNCGGQDPDPNSDGCWCTDDCGGFDDCCEDVCDFCPELAICETCTAVNCTDNVGEACGDDQNSGCSADPPTLLFDDINLGDTKCGNIWADDGLRDLDWFLLEITEPTEVTWAVDADEISNAWIIGGAVTTCGTLDTIAFDSGCSIVLNACLAPGTYAVVVGASVFDGFACPGYQYEATLTGTPVAECDGNGGGDPNSCAGNCGANAGNCWCDEGCCDFADCCADKVAECGGCSPA